MANVVADLSPQNRSFLVEIVGAADPALLAALQSGQLPTREQQDAAEGILYDELSRHLGPGHEPDARGKLISSVIAEFADWFIDHV